MAVPTSTRFYRYMVESLDIIIPSEGVYYPIAGQLVKGLTIERNYDNSMFPIIRLDLSLNTELYYKIINNNTSAMFRLRVQKFVYDQDNKLSMKKDIINDVFVTFNDENTPFLDKATFEASSKLTSGSSKGMTPVTVGGNDVSFYLFKEWDMIYSKKIINGVITKGTVTDTIAYMLASTGFNKTLMAPLDNINEYSEIIVPPFSLQGNLVYLENQFGFYYKGAIIFFDIPCLYILSQSSKATAWRKGEYPKVIFSVKESDNPERFSPGSYFDDHQLTTFVNIRPSNISMSSVSIIRDQIEGNHRMIINPSSGSTTNLKTDTSQRGDGTYKVVVNKYNNKFLNTAEKTTIEADGQNMQIALEDIDFEILTPNKEYSFKFEDGAIHKAYGGNYRLSKSTIFISNEGDHFKLKATAAFKQ